LDEDRPFGNAAFVRLIWNFQRITYYSVRSYAIPFNDGLYLLRHGFCSLKCMLWISIAVSALSGSGLWVWNNLRQAPEGYEDETGFHIIRKGTRGAHVLARKKRGRHHESLPALKEIKA